MSVASITQTSQYLTFNLEGEVFALDISKVREVLEARPSPHPWTMDMVMVGRF